MNPNETASKVLNFITAKHKASEEKPLKLGNVEFWHEVPGFAAGILCYSLPVNRWNVKAIQDDLNRETSTCWNELMRFLGVPESQLDPANE